MKKYELPKHPFITICTPTFNRRPFIPTMIQCFNHQKYPKDKIEWIILDDGTDKIEDLVKHIPQVNYMRFETKLTLGKKRNIGNDNAKGDIIIYMDDDDYYPPERISHVVQMLRTNKKALCAGSSEMYIYFKDIQKMYKFGPYGEKHSTAATFAFRKELLKETRFNENASIAEERHFLKDYTIPFIQLDTKKSILVFSHIHNSCDKKELLQGLHAPLEHRKIFETDVIPQDIIKEPEILKFYMEDIDELLMNYEPGNPINKEDVTKQITELKEKREQSIKQEITNQTKYQDIIQKTINLKQSSSSPDTSFIIDNLTHENNQLKEKILYLEEKIKQLINEKIKEIKSPKL
jgi:glycosyltransferase involved in cell wall biosynthesis